ncbi:MAG: fumarylacetoacetate hydrolase, partial [Oricola sp.]
MSFFPHEKDRDGAFLGRIWSPEAAGPSVVAIRDGMVADITTVAAPLVSDICEMENPAAYVRSMEGRPVGTLEEIAANPHGNLRKPHFLAPCDLQAVKACGVTFASSMVERVIEEKAAGDPSRAQDIRARVGAAIGGSLRDIKAGSQEAAKVKAALVAEGLWSQYLEVGIGPDAEVFSKAQPLSAVG